MFFSNTMRKPMHGSAEYWLNICYVNGNRPATGKYATGTCQAEHFLSSPLLWRRRLT